MKVMCDWCFSVDEWTKVCDKCHGLGYIPLPEPPLRRKSWFGLGVLFGLRKYLP